MESATPEAQIEFRRICALVCTTPTSDENETKKLVNLSKLSTHVHVYMCIHLKQPIDGVHMYTNNPV